MKSNFAEGDLVEVLMPLVFDTNKKQYYRYGVIVEESDPDCDDLWYLVIIAKNCIIHVRKEQLILVEKK